MDNEERIEQEKANYYETDDFSSIWALTSYEKTSELVKAILNNDRQRIALLNENGANINLPDDYGKIPLIYFIEAKQIHAVNALLTNGANPNYCNPDDHNKKIIDYAKETNQDDIIEAICQAIKKKIPISTLHLGRTPRATYPY